MNTFIVSDLHLTDLEPQNARRGPLWKRYKKTKFFIDRSFANFLATMTQDLDGACELVFNGDTFDFDAVVSLPDKPYEFKLNWIEKLRGLSPEEPKSRFKMRSILEAHPLWLDCLRNFIKKGNKIVFVIGNHDLELHWPQVQEEFRSHLNLDESQKDKVVFCEWFYISGKDTLIEHGNQYDAFCVCPNPIHPSIRLGKRVMIRLPFGNLASRFMVNGMGLMNPHTSTSFIKSSFWEYLVFYYRYVIWIQPELLLTWVWSASMTLLVSLASGLRPSLRDPLTVDARISSIAQKAQCSPMVVVALKEVHVQSAILDPLKILRELWLDRLLLLILILFGSIQVVSVLNWVLDLSWAYLSLPLLFSLPSFIFYARSVQSEVEACEKAVFHYAPISARITQVKRMVLGHSHHELHTQLSQVEILNTGTWSPAFQDVECQKPIGRKCFVWIQASKNDAQSVRIAALYEWKDKNAIPIDPIMVPLSPTELEFSEIAQSA